MRNARLLVAIIWLVVGMAQAQNAHGAKLDAGDLRVGQSSTSGFQLDVRQVPVARASSIQLYAPGWKTGYYSSSNSNPLPLLDVKAQTLTREHRDEKAGFRATETVRVVGADRIEWTLVGTMDKDQDALLEYSLGYLNAFALYGGTASAGRGAAVRIAPQAQAPDATAEVISHADQVSFATRLGTLTYKVEEGPAELSLLDGRRGSWRWWAETPSFWIGFLAVKVEPRKEFRIRVSVSFLGAPLPTTGPARVAQVAARATTQAFVPESRPVQIIPKPRKLEWREGRFELSGKTRIYLVNEDARPAAVSLAREVEERFGWKWEISPPQQMRPGGPGIVWLMPAATPLPAEGYEIEIAGDRCVLSASDRNGQFYAVQTLVQMFQTRGDATYFPGARISDSPSLAFRGVHLFTGKDALPFHRKLIERVIARGKFNHLVLECDYTQWATNPKLTTDISVPRPQIEAYVKLAKENCLEVTPLVQSLGHAEWMFKNGQNTELAEDPEARYAYDATNPATYEFVAKIYDETLAMFGGPKYFHIGHDEVTIFGRYPHREKNKAMGVTGLFIEDQRKLAQYFKPKGVRTMLWGDMLLHRSESNDAAANAESVDEAQRRRKSVPRDAIICDWHYEPSAPEAYTSLKVFKEAGFTPIACTWYNPQNIYRFAQGARQFGAWGLLQTTWAGYTVDASTLDREFRQFSAYLLAAEYSWSADSPAPQDLPWRAEDVFVREFSRGREPTRTLAGFTTALPGSPLPEMELPTPPAESRMEGVALTVGRPMVLGGRLAPSAPDAALPTQIDLNVRLEAGGLCFLQATAFPAGPGQEVGAYVVGYADGSTERIPLLYGRNTRWIEDPAATPGASIAYSARSAAGVPLVLRLSRWTNPHAEKPIVRVSFTTAHPYASPILYAITATE